MKKFWNFIQNEDTSETELLFNGPISEDTWWGDEVTPALFRDELAKVSGNLTVWLNSPGGDEVKESIINAYETKSHLSRNKIAKLMSDETWLNAKKAHEMGFVDGILFAEKKMPVVPKEEEPDEEEKEDTLTAMTYSKSKNLSAFLSKVSASAESVTGTSIDQLEKRLALLKY